jgi:Rhs element Vgr protein
MSVIDIEITIEGKPMSAEYELMYVEVKTEYNRIPYAELGFIDGDLATQKYEISESDDFKPGNTIEIKLGYTGSHSASKKPQAVFKGIVLKQGLRINESRSTLVIELNDAAVKMAIGRKSNVFNDVKDSDIITRLINNNGLKAGSVDATNVQHKEIVQYAATDWDFMLCRAEANGLLVSVNAGAITAGAPTMAAPATATYEVGINEIYDLDLEADGRNQFAEITGASWDIKKQQLTSPAKAGSFNLEQGNFKPADIAKAIGGNSDALLTGIALEEKEAKAWADAKMIKSRLSFLKGRFKVPGDATIKVGGLVEIKGVGKRFNGKTLVTGVRQFCNEDGWFTDIQFGLPAAWFAAQAPFVTDVKAAGLLPGVNGLQVGVVEKWEDDPDKENRVKVKVPAINTDNGVLWSRLTTISAGNNAGIFFQPEPGDEVILGFLNDDPRQPVILGSVHSSANPPPLKPADKNPEKGIVTKEGIKILLNDENKLLTIETSDKNTIIINDKDKFIEIKDANNNIVKLSADGITLDSGKDIIIKAKGGIKMEASAKVEIKGSAIDIT